ncbi:uncharacterized protein E6C27_scaffold538G001040 [Cucumis melo var. makuwa]|nr:uncharacterized protein E6C27_scaffold538G001040 [Cucumis melo var. makuwa]
MFINTLRVPYYDKTVGSASTNFSDIITIEERIEFEVKNERIVDPTSKTKRTMTPKKKGGRSTRVELNSKSSDTCILTNCGTDNYFPSYQNEGQSPFELLPQLLKSHQVAIVSQKPMQPPYPKWYDPKAKCEYHARAVGHSSKNCFPLKAKMQSLVKANWLKFKKTREESDVNQNPLPNHEGPAINVVNTFMERYKNKVSDVTTLMNTFFQILYGAGYLSPTSNNDDVEKVGCAKKRCLFHQETDDHSI